MDEETSDVDSVEGFGHGEIFFHVFLFSFLYVITGAYFPEEVSEARFSQLSLHCTIAWGLTYVILRTVGWTVYRAFHVALCAAMGRGVAYVFFLYF